MAQKEDIKPCFRCSKMPNEKDVYCTDCGAPLKNTCCDEPGLLEKGCGHVNPPDAGYCVKCGLPTTYQLFGLVKPDYPYSNWTKFIETTQYSAANRK